MAIIRNKRSANYLVQRSGFYLKDGKIIQQNVNIEWGLGYNPDAKAIYIKSLHEALKEKGCKNIHEVTTAAPKKIDRMLSPVFLKAEDGQPLEDFYGEVLHTIKNNSVKECVFLFQYFIALQESCYEHIMEIDTFTDVFFNPSTALLTQAKALAIFQLLYSKGYLSVLKDSRQFTKWYIDNVLENCVIKG